MSSTLRSSIQCLINKQITCLYDMDIVTGPNGNFDEVYLYVCPAFSHILALD